MDLPLRRYCFKLAEKLGMTHSRLIQEMSYSEVLEWAAYDLTKDDEWYKQYEIDQLSEEEKLKRLQRMFGMG